MEVINTFIGKLFGWDLRYREEWSTDLVSYDTGKEQRNQIWERPKRHWVLPYNALITTYRDKLKELCSRAKGIYNVFLFEDPYDYECAFSECSITAIEGEDEYQLIKTYYGDSETETWNENKTRIQPNTIFQPIIFVGDDEQVEGVEGAEEDYILDYDTGIITFTVVPEEVITAKYQFYYPVRKEEDDYNEATIASGTWNMGDIPIVEVIE